MAIMGMITMIYNALLGGSSIYRLLSLCSFQFSALNISDFHSSSMSEFAKRGGGQTWGGRVSSQFCVRLKTWVMRILLASFNIHSL